MRMIRVPLACLALLVACGGNDNEAPGAPSKTTAKTSEPAKSKPTDTVPQPAPIPSKPVPSEPATPPEVADAESILPVTPPDETAPGIVHADPTTPPAGEKPLAEVEKDEGLLLDEPEADTTERAVARLSPASASQVTGTVTFIALAAGVEVRVQLEGLTPGKHGLHIHEVGDCSAADASSAGDHFNPGNAPHGGPNSPARHVGDLGNVEADAAGRVDTTFLDNMLSLTGTSTIVGHSVIVHADPDDLVTQPVGNSGDRIACGVIEVQPAPGAAIGGG